jgi:hypothetical protein
MPVVPTGDPAWVRTSSLETYGGHAEKRNHLGQGSIDALTDVSAEEFSRLTADLAAIMRTAPFGSYWFVCNDTSPAAPTIVAVNSMIGIRTTPYEGDAAPPGFPSAVRNGTGDVTFTWDASYTDPYGVAGVFGVANPYGNATAVNGNISKLKFGYTPGGLTLQVQAFDTSNVALADALVSFSVYSGGA